MATVFQTPLLATNFSYAQSNENFNYEKPFIILTTLSEKQNSSNLTYEKGPAEIVTNIRGKESEYALDTHGFQFLRSELPGIESRDWKNRKDVEGVHLPEMENFLKDNVEGVDEVVFFDWRVCYLTELTFLLFNLKF